MRQHARTRLAILAVGLSAVLPLAACGGDDDASDTPTPDASPAATATGTAPATATVSIEDEVIESYLAYWDRYAAAVLDLNADLVADLAGPEELARVQGEVEMLRTQGVALRVVIEHNPVVVESSDSTAVVYDEMTNNSFYVDPVTKEPPEAEGTGEMLKDTFFLEKVDGQWTVIRSVRQR